MRRRRRLDRRLRAVARDGDDALLDEIERLQRGRLRLDRRAARLAARAARRGRGRAVGASSPARVRAESREAEEAPSRPLTAGCAAARARATDERRALAHGAAARLPPPRGEAGLVGVLRAGSRSTTRSSSTTPRRSAGLELDDERRARGRRSSLVYALDVPGAGAQARPGDDAIDPATGRSAGHDRRDRRRRRGASGSSAGRSSERRRCRAALDSRRAVRHDDAAGGAAAAAARSRSPATGRYRASQDVLAARAAAIGGASALAGAIRRRAASELVGARPAATCSSRARPARARPGPARG